MPYCAAQVSELFSCWQIFSVHSNWIRIEHVQQYHLLDLQANLICVSAESGRLFLHVLVIMRPRLDHPQNLGPPALGRGSI